MKQYIKIFASFAILTFAAGCSTYVTLPVPTATQNYNQIESSAFKALGRVSVVVPVSSDEKVGVYSELLKAAKKIGGNDVINIYIDEIHGDASEYRATGLAIKHR